MVHAMHQHLCDLCAYGLQDSSGLRISRATSFWSFQQLCNLGDTCQGLRQGLEHVSVKADAGRPSPAIYTPLAYPARFFRELLDN